MRPADPAAFKYPDERRSHVSRTAGRDSARLSREQAVRLEGMREERAPAGDVSAIRERLGLAADQDHLVATLLQLGVSVEAMEHAQARGHLRDAIFDMVLDPDRALRTVSAREIEERGGWPARATLEMISAFGFPSPGPDEPYFNPEEADALLGAAARQEWWPLETQMETSRCGGRCSRG